MADLSGRKPTVNNLVCAGRRCGKNTIHSGFAGVDNVDTDSAGGIFAGTEPAGNNPALLEEKLATHPHGWRTPTSDSLIGNLLRTPSTLTLFGCTQSCCEHHGCSGRKSADSVRRHSSSLGTLSILTMPEGTKSILLHQVEPAGNTADSFGGILLGARLTLDCFEETSSRLILLEDRSSIWLEGNLLGTPGFCRRKYPRLSYLLEAKLPGFPSILLEASPRILFQASPLGTFSSPTILEATRRSC